MVLLLCLHLVARPFASLADAQQVRLAITNRDFFAGIGGGKRMASLAVGLPLTVIRVLAKFGGKRHGRGLLQAHRPSGVQEDTEEFLTPSVVPLRFVSDASLAGTSFLGAARSRTIYF